MCGRPSRLRHLKEVRFLYLWSIARVPTTVNCLSAQMAWLALWDNFPCNKRHPEQCQRQNIFRTSPPPTQPPFHAGGGDRSRLPTQRFSSWAGCAWPLLVCTVPDAPFRCRGFLSLPPTPVIPLPVRLFPPTSPSLLFPSSCSQANWLQVGSLAARMAFAGFHPCCLCHATAFPGRRFLQMQRTPFLSRQLCPKRHKLVKSG